MKKRKYKSKRKKYTKKKKKREKKEKKKKEKKKKIKKEKKKEEKERREKEKEKARKEIQEEEEEESRIDKNVIHFNDTISNGKIANTKTRTNTPKKQLWEKFLIDNKINRYGENLDSWDHEDTTDDVKPVNNQQQTKKINLDNNNRQASLPGYVRDDWDSELDKPKLKKIKKIVPFGYTQNLFQSVQDNKNNHSTRMANRKNFNNYRKNQRNRNRGGGRRIQY